MKKLPSYRGIIRTPLWLRGATNPVFPPDGFIQEEKIFNRTLRVLGL